MTHFGCLCLTWGLDVRGRGNDDLSFFFLTSSVFTSCEQYLCRLATPGWKLAV
jgi:hypothetical protein